MFYYFKADEDIEKDKKVQKLLSRVKEIENVNRNGLQIHAIFSIISIFGLNIVFYHFDIQTKWYLILLLSFAIGGFLKTLFQACLNEHKTYKKLSKALKCPVFIRKIGLSKENEIVGGIYYPSLDISYEVDNPSDDTIALLCQYPDSEIEDDVIEAARKYIFVTNIDTSKKGVNKVRISSDVLGKAINKLGRTNELIRLVICQVNKDINDGIIKESDCNKRFFVVEDFYFDFDYDDEEDGD